MVPDTKELISGAAVLHQQVAKLEVTGTECKRPEGKLKELEQQPYLPNRPVSISQMAADVAHEVNNHLTGILGFSQRLLRKTTDEEVSRDLQRINAEAKRAAEVVQELLSFTHHLE
jgi:two-component system NtrC family sensor kinase